MSEVLAGTVPAEPAPPQRAIGVLGISVGLALLALLLVLIARMHGGRVDGAEALEALFEDGAGLSGYALGEARSLPGGERLVPLRAADPPGAGPEELVFWLTPSPKQVSALFERGAPAIDDERRREWDREPTFAFSGEIERGNLEWGTWQAPFVRERSFREGGGFQERMWVNLSGARSGTALFARWPENANASHEQLEALLAGLRLRSDR